MTVWTSVLWKMKIQLARNGQKWSWKGHLTLYLGFTKKEAVTTRWRSSQLLSWSLFEWLILTKCHSKISIYPQKLSNEINEKALVIQTNLKFFNPKQQNLWNFSMVKWRKFKNFNLCYRGIIISNLIILLVP